MAPTLLFLPGSLCDSRVWRPVADALGADYPCATVEYGDQDSIAAMCSDILEQNQGPLLPVGLSMGGMVALEMWRQAPQRMAAIVFCGTNPAADTAERMRVRAAQLSVAEADGLQALALQHLAPAYFSGHGAEAVKLKQIVMEMTKNAGIAKLKAQFKALATRADSWPTLPTISVPVLVLYGANDMICPPQLQSSMAAQLPCPALYEIPRAGHLAPLEQPAAIVARIHEWLSSTLSIQAA